MTAPLFLLEAGTLDGRRVGDLVTLDGAEGRHAATVRRIGAGEVVQVADGTGRVGLGEVTEAGRDALVIRLTEVSDIEPAQPRLVLVQALAKGDRDEQAIEAATELGVDVVVPWQAERSIVQWRGERAAKAHRKWESVVRAAAKQSRRPTVPEVGELVDRRRLVALIERADLAVVLHEDGDQRFVDVSLPTAGDVVLVVGPEGGIGGDELEALVTAGGQQARLGDTVLRSSSAGPAALAVLASRLRW